jgi:hypothetical protein
VKVEHDKDGVRLTLVGTEVKLMQRALEKASFIDIPRDEQPAVAAFCTRALEQLGSGGS